MKTSSRFFVGSFLNDFLPSIKKYVREAENFRKHQFYVLIIITVAVALLAIFIFQLAYIKNNQELQDIRNFLAREAANNENYLEHIDYLQQKLQQADKWYNKFYLNSVTDVGVSNTINEIRLKYDELTIVPMLVLYLEGRLSNGSYNGDIESFIDDFYIYLSIQGLEPFNNKEVKSWLTRNIEKVSLFSGVKKNVLESTFNNINLEMFSKASFDNNLYSRLIAGFNGSDIAYLINEALLKKLKTHPDFLLSSFFPRDFIQLFEKDLQLESIPFIYTKEGYSTYFSLQGKILNKILNIKYLSETLDPGTLKDLMQQITSIYMMNYASYWNKFLSKVSFKKAYSLQHYLDILKNIAFYVPSLFQVIQVIDSKLITANYELPIENKLAIQPDNQQIDYAENEIINTIKYKQLDAKVLLTLKEKLLQNLQELIQYISLLVNSSDSNEASFKAVVNFETLKDSTLTKALEMASILPEPLNFLYTNLVNNIKDVIYTNAATYINSYWKKLIYNFYMERLKNKYPFNSQNYDNQVALKDFTDFFSKDGLLDSFITQYLQMKNITITNEGKDFLEFANYIRENWFNDKGQLEVKFSIEPYKMDNALTKVILSLYGKETSFTQDKLESMIFSWPENKKGGYFAKLEFVDEVNHKVVEYYEGVWAWYRLFGLDYGKHSTELAKSNVFESVLGNFEFSIDYGKKALTLSNYIYDASSIPVDIVTIEKNENLYDK